MNNGIGIVCE